tara:strand:+ start:704 stop:1207 length:504 start_codon:yes stop_codon:yes gene_type:complete
MGIVRTVIANAAVEYSQLGFLIGQTDGNSLGYAHHAGGYDGSGTKQWVEFIFGKDCGNLTSADSTTGTFFYPDIPYATSIFTMSTNNITRIATALQFKNHKIEERYDFSFNSNQDNFSRTGTYDPSDDTNYLFLDYSDEIFGRFTRVAIDKPITGADDFRIKITKGI